MVKKKGIPLILRFSFLSSVLILVAGFGVMLSSTNGNVDNVLSPLTQKSEYDSSEGLAYFDGRQIPLPGGLAKDVLTDKKILGDITSPLAATKHIVVDLSIQTLIAYEDGREIMRTLVSTGKWGRTPTGTFKIWGKFRFTKMSGGSGRSYYYLPNVPYVMFFSNNEIAAGRGFSLHGTYWHDNFGHPMSHGCVNMRTVDAGTMYEWTGPVVPEGKNSITSSATNPGTQIEIIGQAPSN
jgi:lipoprotein-anchoring transpeptidase ErfK/SrfK